MVRVLVFGAGPLGSVMAARLHEAGHEVSLLARGQRLDDLKNHGVVLQDEESGEQEIARVPLKEGFRGLRLHLGVRPAPRSFRLLELLPEPIWMWLLRSTMRKGEARSSIEGHSAAARDELEHVAGELLSQLRAAGVKAPTIGRLLTHVDPQTPTWPDGSRDIPMRWGGVAIPVLALAAVVTLLVGLF